MNAVLPCSIDRQCATKREAAPRGKNWQQRRRAGSAGVSQPRDLDGTIFVPVSLSLYRISHAKLQWSVTYRASSTKLKETAVWLLPFCILFECLRT
jgi:hypothetical protein